MDLGGITTADQVARKRLASGFGYRDLGLLFKLAYGRVFRNFRSFAKISALMVLMSFMIGFMALYFFKGMQAGNVQQMAPTYIPIHFGIQFLSFVVMVAFVYSWLRWSVRGDKEPAKLFPKVDKLFLRFIGAILLFTVGFFILFFLLSLVLIPIAQIFANSNKGWLSQIVFFTLSICFAVIPLRYSLALPILSLNPNTTIFEAMGASWDWTRGQVIKLIVAFLFIGAPFMLLSTGINLVQVVPMWTGKMGNPGEIVERMISFAYVSAFVMPIINILGVGVLLSFLTQACMSLSGAAASR